MYFRGAPAGLLLTSTMSSCRPASPVPFRTCSSPRTIVLKPQRSCRGSGGDRVRSRDTSLEGTLDVSSTASSLGPSRNWRVSGDCGVGCFLFDVSVAGANDFVARMTSSAASIFRSCCARLNTTEREWRHGAGEMICRLRNRH